MVKIKLTTHREKSLVWLFLTFVMMSVQAYYRDVLGRTKWFNWWVMIAITIMTGFCVLMFGIHLKIKDK